MTNYEKGRIIQNKMQDVMAEEKRTHNIIIDKNLFELIIIRYGESKYYWIARVHHNGKRWKQIAKGDADHTHWKTALNHGKADIVDWYLANIDKDIEVTIS